MIRLLLILPIIVYANYAKVTAVSGKVTKLQVGDIKASKVKLGDFLREDSSILVNENSFVKLLIQNKTIITVSDKGKIVIGNLKKERPGLIKLLFGHLKARVLKKVKKNKTSLLIKTQNTVMGVRGTTFQISFNPKNEKSSLLTIDGQVDMAKIPKKNVSKVAVNEKEFEKILQEEVVETVKHGEYSGVSKEVKNPTAPLKISKKQFVVIKKIAKKEMKIKNEREAKFHDKETLVKNENNESGGFLDFETGHYIDSSKSEKNLKSLGSIDKKTGKYIPPKGVKLDAVKGFITGDRKELSKLNNLLASTSKNVIQSENIKKKLNYKTYYRSQLTFDKYFVNINDGQNRSFTSTIGSTFVFSKGYRLTKDSNLELSFQKEMLEFRDLTGKPIFQNRRNFYTVKARIYTEIYRNLNLIAASGYSEKLIFKDDFDSFYVEKSRFIPILLGMDYSFFQNNDFKTSIEGTYSYNLSLNLSDYQLRNGRTFQIKSKNMFLIDNNINLSFNLLGSRNYIKSLAGTQKSTKASVMLGMSVYF